MTERDITAVEDTIRHYDCAEQPNKERVPGIATRKIPFCAGGPGPGYDLAVLLQKAAGLEDFRIRSIDCRVAVGECVMFKAEIYGNEADVAKAVAENQ